MMLNETVQGFLEESIKLRRDLHQIPEVGFSEYKTSDYICKYLDAYGFDYERNVAGTGVLAHISVDADKTIAFRADMDALSMTEFNDVEFKSTHEGCMHACGHDGHMTMLLLLAKYLVEKRESLKQNVLLIFQPAEEGPGGAEPMIETGFLDKYQVDEVFGIHLHPDFEEGVVAIKEGPVMAMTGEFDIDIKGKSGHGAMPHTGNDVLMIMSSLLQQYQTIVSRNVDPTEAAVVTVGKLFGGERRNIIADHIRLEGTIRAFSEDVYQLITRRMAEIIKGLEAGFDCDIELELRTMYPPVVNHKSSVEIFTKANASMNVVEFNPQMISEDFSYFLKEKPGAFIFLGIKNDRLGYDKPLHNSRFNFDEKALLFGLQSYINLLNAYGSDL